jgi:hypothetical protein
VRGSSATAEEPGLFGWKRRGVLCSIGEDLGREKSGGRFAMDGDSLCELNRRRDAQNRENVALAGLGIRTSADIFEAATRRQLEEARSWKAPARAGPPDASELASLGIRTSAEIWQTTQTLYEEERGKSQNLRQQRIEKTTASSRSAAGEIREAARHRSPGSERPGRPTGRKRAVPTDTEDPAAKRVRMADGRERTDAERAQDVASVFVIGDSQLPQNGLHAARQAASCSFKTGSIAYWKRSAKEGSPRALNEEMIGLSATGCSKLALEYVVADELKSNCAYCIAIFKISLAILHRTGNSPFDRRLRHVYVKTTAFHELLFDFGAMLPDHLVHVSTTIH